MGLTTLTREGRLDLPDGSTVVVIPMYGQHERFAQCLASVLAHTPHEVPIVIADDASPDPASRLWAEHLAREGCLTHAVHWARGEEHAGFVSVCNAAFAMASRADVVLLNSHCVVAAGWLEGLYAALLSDASIATATPLTNHGGIVSVPHRNTPVAALPQDTTLEAAAVNLRHVSRRLRPRVPTAIGHCFLIRRAALDLVGAFDEAFAPGYGAEIDFSQRCTAAGMQHVVADDVLVLHRGDDTFADDADDMLANGAGPADATDDADGAKDMDEARSELRMRHEQLLNRRYPFYLQTMEECATSTDNRLARALAIARTAILGPGVTVDVRCLGPILTGTQLHALELVHALWRTREVRLRLLVPDDLGAYAQPIIDSMIGVQTIREHQITAQIGRDPIVHRPFQASSLRDLALLELLGERLVVTHQDLIAYRNPGYFETPQQWEAFRELTREALGTASMVLFFSRHAADDALTEDLVPPERVRVAKIGVDHELTALEIDPRTPPVAGELSGAPFLLCLGTDFKHKNRVFALRLVHALQQRHGWQGRLVFCGPHVTSGSSAGQEAAWLASRPGVARAVVDVAAVDESGKRWLLSHATAIVYPTTYEGFGLVPFEAAAAGVPCLFAHVSSLTELFAPDAATMTPWDPAQTADRVVPLLQDGPERSAHLSLLTAAAVGLTWDQTASAILDAYQEAMALPGRDLTRIPEKHIPDARYWALRHQIGPTGMSLVGAGEPLLPERTQRALAALARRPLTRGPLLTVLHALHRLTPKRGKRPASSALEPPATAPSGEETGTDPQIEVVRSLERSSA